MLCMHTKPFLWISTRKSFFSSQNPSSLSKKFPQNIPTFCFEKQTSEKEANKKSHTNTDARSREQRKNKMLMPSATHFCPLSASVNEPRKHLITLRRRYKIEKIPTAWKVKLADAKTRPKQLENPFCKLMVKFVRSNTPHWGTARGTAASGCTLPLCVSLLRSAAAAAVVVVFGQKWKIESNAIEKKKLNWSANGASKNARLGDNTHIHVSTQFNFIVALSFLLCGSGGHVPVLALLVCVFRRRFSRTVLFAQQKKLWCSKIESRSKLYFQLSSFWSISMQTHSNLLSCSVNLILFVWMKWSKVDDCEKLVGIFEWDSSTSWKKNLHHIRYGVVGKSSFRQISAD